MINPINSIANVTPAYYGICFRSNNNNNNSLSFTPKLRSPLTTDVFINTGVSSGGTNGSINTIKKINDLLPNYHISKFCPDTKEKERNKIIEEEKKHIAQVVRKRTEYNTNQLRSAGVAEKDIKKYLTIDGHVNFEGKKILKEHGKSYK